MSNVLLYCRIKPSLIADKAVRAHQNTVTVSTSKKPLKFEFDRVIPASASQTEVYDDNIHDLIRSTAIGGRNTIITFGTSKSGKNFTLKGQEGKLKGILVRAVETLLAVGGSVNISILQVYQDVVTDMLGCGNRGLILDSRGPHGYHKRLINNTADLYDTLQQSFLIREAANRQDPKMKYKSHLLYWIKNATGGLMFVELAGSENASSDQAIAKKNALILEERRSIAKTFNAISVCLGDRANVFSESSLLLLLKDYLNRVILFCNISLSKSLSKHTLAALKYMKRIREKRLQSSSQFLLDMEAVKEERPQGSLTSRLRWPNEDILNLETQLHDANEQISDLCRQKQDIQSKFDSDFQRSQYMKEQEQVHLHLRLEELDKYNQQLEQQVNQLQQRCSELQDTTNIAMRDAEQQRSYSTRRVNEQIYQLEQQLQDQSQKIQYMQKENLELKDYYEQEYQKNGELEQTNNQLQYRLEQLNILNQKLEESLQLLQKRCEQAEKTSLKLTKEIEQQKTKAISKSSLYSLEQQLNDANLQIQRLQKEKSDAQYQYDMDYKRQDRILQESNQNRSRIEQLQEYNSQIENKLNIVQLKYDELQSTASTAIKDADNRKIKVKQLKKQLNLALAQLERKGLQKSPNKQTFESFSSNGYDKNAYSELLEENYVLKGEIQELTRNLEESSHYLSEQENHIKWLENQIEELKPAQDTIKQQKKLIKRLQKEKQQAIEKAKNVESQIQLAESRLQEVEKNASSIEISGRFNELDSLENQVIQIEAELQRIREQNKRLTQREQDIQQELRKSEKQRARTKEKNQDLKQQIQSLQNELQQTEQHVQRFLEQQKQEIQGIRGGSKGKHANERLQAIQDVHEMIKKHRAQVSFK